MTQYFPPMFPIMQSWHNVTIMQIQLSILAWKSLCKWKYSTHLYNGRQSIPHVLAYYTNVWANMRVLIWLQGKIYYTSESLCSKLYLNHYHLILPFLLVISFPISWSPKHNLKLKHILHSGWLCIISRPTIYPGRCASLITCSCMQMEVHDVPKLANKNYIQ